MRRPLQEHRKHKRALSYKNPHVKGLVSEEFMPGIKMPSGKDTPEAVYERTQKVNLRKYLLKPSRKRADARAKYAFGENTPKASHNKTQNRKACAKFLSKRKKMQRLKTCMDIQTKGRLKQYLSKRCFYLQKHVKTAHIRELAVENFSSKPFVVIRLLGMIEPTVGGVESSALFLFFEKPVHFEEEAIV